MIYKNQLQHHQILFNTKISVNLCGHTLITVKYIKCIANILTAAWEKRFNFPLDIFPS